MRRTTQFFSVFFKGLGHEPSRLSTLMEWNELSTKGKVSDPEMETFISCAYRVAAAPRTAPRKAVRAAPIRIKGELLRSVILFCSHRSVQCHCIVLAYLAPPMRKLGTKAKLVERVALPANARWKYNLNLLICVNWPAAGSSQSISGQNRSRSVNPCRNLWNFLYDEKKTPAGHKMFWFTQSLASAVVLGSGLRDFCQ